MHTILACLYEFFLFVIRLVIFMLNIPFILAYFAAKQLLELSLYPISYASKAADALMGKQK